MIRQRQRRLMRRLGCGDMTLYLDTADVSEWDRLMPTGIFHGITTNPLLAHRAGLVYPAIDWATLTRKARDLGASELHAQVYGPPAGYVDWAGQLYEAGRAAEIETVVKIPLVEEAIRTVPAIRALGGRILMTACFDAKQMLIAKALGADFIAPYVGRMDEAGIDIAAHLSAMIGMNCDGTKPCAVLAASLRSAAQMVAMSRVGVAQFTIAPAVADDLLTTGPSVDALAQFEQAALGS